MKIAEKKDVARLQRLLHHQFSVIKHRILLAARPYPLSIQVLTNNGASIVANDDSIWIKHGNYFKHKCIS